jgi:hypothetical protein
MSYAQKDNPPWITTKIKKYIRRKNRIHKKAKKTNTIGQWEKFRKIRNKCNKLILNAKQLYFDKISEKINTETNRISSTSFSVTVICSRPLINISVISGTEVSESLRSACLQNSHWKIRNKCNKLILNAKQSYFDKISEKINTETNGSKNWWNLVKNLLHSDSGGDRSSNLFKTIDQYIGNIRYRGFRIIKVSLFAKIVIKQFSFFVIVLYHVNRKMGKISENS